jgi:hypothetical protein
VRTHKIIVVGGGQINLRRPLDKSSTHFYGRREYKVLFYLFFVYDTYSCIFFVKVCMIKYQMPLVYFNIF